MKAATKSRAILPKPYPFQSTPPVKAATRNCRQYTYQHVISIHAAREGGDKAAAQGMPDINISIHAAREGGDCTAPLVSIGIQHFNPRRP